MMEPQIPAAVARSGAQAASRMMQAASSPYVMVRHGRREDRAAVYDRFIAACARVFHNGKVDQDTAAELLAALLALDLRAPKHVRTAAYELFYKIVGPFGIDWKWWNNYTAEDFPPDPDEEYPEDEDHGGPPTPYLRSSEQFLRELMDFTGRAGGRDCAVVAHTADTVGQALVAGPQVTGVARHSPLHVRLP
ncbi:hypothetical protein ACFTY8_48560 [Streptomyces mirabilis]|uniref:hypothetical protein n=1 Tax=Streptomyces mirabilis TaxID=68239 RepID=UPI00363903D7